jgi:hypothetical protein
MPGLTSIIDNPPRDIEVPTWNGACRNVCSYYYSIMLLTRPFLIYQLYEHLGSPIKPRGTYAEHRDKMKYGNAALDAASGLVDMLYQAVDRICISHRMPMVV